MRKLKLFVCLKVWLVHREQHEVAVLKRSDVDWYHNVFCIPGPKLEHLEEHVERVISIFGE